MILIKGGNVDLLMSDGTTLVVPRDYGLVHDETGSELPRCSLFLAPVEDAGEFEEDAIPEDARDYFGDTYVPRRAIVDVPRDGWNLVGHVNRIVYYRPGEYEDDWDHEFSESVPLSQSGECYRIELGEGCKANWRGIVRP